MKKQTTIVFRFGFISLLFALIFSSCIPMKRIQYLQQEVSKKDTLETHFRNVNITRYRIQPGDNLYIKVQSILAGSENIFNQDDTESTSNFYSPAGIYLNGYEVNDAGFIDFPFVGSVYVNGLTIDEAKNLIKSIVKDYIKESTVIVKLGTFKVTSIGEVNNPGEYNIYQNRLTIFDLLAMAGDMTDFARRDKVFLVRETTTGSRVERLNLNDISILESEFYYIKPNDILYVPPVKGKNFAFAQFPYALVFSTISTTLLLINFFQTN
ncbi:MAG: polysaccharide biosynthesis/export family protein [Bacteroidales bacterium]